MALSIMPDAELSQWSMWAIDRIVGMVMGHATRADGSTLITSSVVRAECCDNRLTVTTHSGSVYLIVGGHPDLRQALLRRFPSK